MRCIKVFCENPPKELIVFFRNSWRFFIFPKRLRRLLENEIPGENYSPKFLSFFLNEGLLNGNIRDRGFIEIRDFRFSVILRGFRSFNWDSWGLPGILRVTFLGFLEIGRDPKESFWPLKI